MNTVKQLLKLFVYMMRGGRVQTIDAVGPSLLMRDEKDGQIP